MYMVKSVDMNIYGMSETILMGKIPSTFCSTSF